jgi:predicted permease
MGRDRGRSAYRALLRLFPPGFRAERGSEMERLFEELRAAWKEERGRPDARFWLSVAWDTARGAAGEWGSLATGTMGRATGVARGETMSQMMADVRYAWRRILREPLYAGLILLLMTVGIAGNAAVFRIFNGLFLRPLPFEDAGRLVDLDETAPQWNLEYVGIAYPDFVAWRESNRTFESMAVYDAGGTNFASGGTAERISYVAASYDLADVLRLKPELGRFFDVAEDVPDGAKVVLLSDGFWAQKFDRDAGVLGSSISLDGEPHEVIGVLPPAARFVADAQVWTPLQESPDSRRGWYLTGVGRLEPGVTMEQALADLTSLHKGLIESREENQITSPVMSSLRDRYLGDVRLGAGLLLAAVGIVLLIACANIAGLMYARSLTREDEMAVRLALGAGRVRIASQLLTESALLAVIGAAAGAILGLWGSGALVGAMADRFPPWVTFDLDARVFGFGLCLTAGAILVFGLTPALRTAGRAHTTTAGRATASASRRRGMGLLVMGEVALAVVLLVVGGLSVLDVWRLGRVDPGFRVAGVTSYALSLPSARYPDADSREAFIEDYLERLRAEPGVAHVAAASSLPLSGHWGWFYVVEGDPPRGKEDTNPVVLQRVVTPGYLETMGVQLLAGRGFDEFDGREEGAGVVIVNETFARTRMGGVEGAVGRRIAPGTGAPDEEDWLTVVGVTRDVMHYGVDTPMRPGVYQPWRQIPLSGMQIALVYDGSTADAVATARRVTADLDPELPLASVRTMSESMDRSLWTRRATSWLIGTFSAVALLLAVAGLYGVISYSVSERTREISVRMAVGAGHGQVLAQVVRQGMVLVAAGVGVGLLGSLAVGGLVSGILVEVGAREPTVYIAVTALLLVVAALANFVPARRASRLDPMVALRGE